MSANGNFSPNGLICSHGSLLSGRQPRPFAEKFDEKLVSIGPEKGVKDP